MLVCCLFVVLAAIFGLCYSVVQLSKDTQVSSANPLLRTKDGAHLVGVGAATASASHTDGLSSDQLPAMQARRTCMVEPRTRLASHLSALPAGALAPRVPPAAQQPASVPAATMGQQLMASATPRKRLLPPGPRRCCT